MSGIVKGIKKAFKSVGKFIKKHWKTILIAAAVVFTAGVALAYFAPAAMAASGVAGFGSAGIFTSTAAALGSSGAAAVMTGTAATTTAAGAGVATAALGTGVTAAEGASLAGYAAATGAGGAAAGAAAGVGVWSPQVLAAASAAGVTPAAAAAALGGGSHVAAAAGLSSFEKIMAAQMIVNTASGLVAKKDPYPIQKQYGTYDRKGNGPGMALRFNPQTGNVERTSSSQMAFLPSGANEQPQQPDQVAAKTAIPAQPEQQQDDQGAQGQFADAGSQPSFLPDDQALNPQGGPTLADRQGAIEQGYKTGDYSGMGA